jgi:hypothetical protein
MNGYIFLLASLVIAFVGVGLYNLRPALDRRHGRLEADIARMRGMAVAENCSVVEPLDQRGLKLQPDRQVATD